MFRNDHQDEFYELTRSDMYGEEIYEQYHRAVQSGDLSGFLASTNMEDVRQHHMYLPQLTPCPVDLLLEKFYFPEDNRQIYVSHHVRHMPPFLHTHEFFEISYLLDGRAEHTIDGRVLAMNPGDLCVIPPFTEHSMIRCDGLLFNILLKASSFEVTYRSLLNDYSSPLVSFLYHSFFCSNLSKYYFIKNTDCPEAAHELLQLLILEKLRQKNCNADDLPYVWMMKSFFALLSERSAAQNGSSDNLPLYPHSAVPSILNYLKQHYKEATLQSVAKAFNYSPSYVSRLIKAQTQTNFVSIQRRLKINEACRLLKETELSVSDISAEIGFESCSSFYKAFMAQTGHTPSAYRMS
ncbi:MAG: helix-turn-helix domain-containing protein [Clostridia bacterium]|nr:helix-turn-helix domain-containing protein [Clostridia bacterium]